MTDKEFTKFMKELECNYFTVRENLTVRQTGDLLNLLVSMLHCNDHGDALKKSIYYGKELTYPDYEVTLFNEEQIASIFESLTEKQLRLVHMCFGAYLEFGEILSALLYHISTNQEIDKINIEEELGDVDFFVTGLKDELQLDSKKIRIKNVQKLSTRFKDGKFSSEEALDRDLVAEREVLSKEDNG